MASINALIRRDSSRSNYVEQLLGALPASRVNIEWVRTGQGTPDPINTGTPRPAAKEQQPTQAPPSPQLARAVLSNNMTPLETPLLSWEHEKTLPPARRHSRPPTSRHRRRLRLHAAGHRRLIRPGLRPPRRQPSNPVDSDKRRHGWRVAVLRRHKWSF